MISLSGVTKRFGTATVVDGISLEFEQGKCTVLIGPSGCGKSTLIRMVAGLIRPDAGDVVFDGRPLDDATLPELRRRLGYVIQTGGLFPHLTARQNALLMPRRLGWEPARMDARVSELAELARLPEDALDRYPLQLSGGQRQRVSLMRALMLDPDVLLLDEPLGALDPLVRADLQQDLRDAFQKLHKTVVLVTHDIGEAWYFGDRIALLK
ncbi:MAG: ATP-binding cassette domain-containing protein, partial [Myxococcales bacterium]|nr:ATP-binding cassette domain-containing protein [Myxococcales bacterium]